MSNIIIPSGHVCDHRGMAYFSIDNAVAATHLRVIGSHAFAIYSLLCMYAGSRDACFPGVSTLAEQSGQSRSGVQNGLKRLVAAGLITIESKTRVDGGQSSNNYILLPVPSTPPAHAVGSPQDMGEPAHTVSTPCPPHRQAPAHTVGTNKNQSELESNNKNKQQEAVSKTVAEPQTSQAVVVSLTASECNANAGEQSDQDLIAQLTQIGISPSVGLDLLRDSHAEVIRQLEFWPHQALEGVENKAGWFRRAVLEAYAPPASFEAARRSAKRKQKAKMSIANEQALESQKQADDTALRQSRMTHWQALTPRQQMDIDAHAASLLSPILRRSKMQIEIKRWEIVDAACARDAGAVVPAMSLAA